MLALLWELLIGLIVGALAKFVMPGKDPGGIFITMAIGIAGSIGATFLGQMIGWYRQGQSAGFIMSVLGAVLILWIYRLIKARTAA
ncbi:MAG TPA: GlsB/YeaQ/YmgE family stress response membrane protein [Terriglobales bacterium]|nr:GlsB/YeaQ/YmgE family stress response membrane protein [Terriglobales bacterium]